MLVQKGQLTQCIQQIGSECSGHSGHAVDTVNAVDAVGVGAKTSTHTVYSANMGGGDHYL